MAVVSPTANSSSSNGVVAYLQGLAGQTQHHQQAAVQTVAVQSERHLQTAQNDV